MSETTSSTDWTALALQAMDQQQQQQQEAITAEQELQEASESSYGPGALRFIAGIAQLLFWAVLAYFLVLRYGVFNLVWIGLIIWYQVIPSMTFRKKSAYK